MLRDEAIRALGTSPGFPERALAEPSVAVYGRAVAELSRALAPGNPLLGLQLIEKHFPTLAQRWRGHRVGHSGRSPSGVRRHPSAR